MFACACQFLLENLWIILITCFVFLASRFYFGSKLAKVTDETTSFETCTSPSCVRCRRHTEILTRARTKLSYHAFSNETEHGDYMHRLYTDIENSYHKRIKEKAGFDQKPSVFKFTGLSDMRWWDSENLEQLGLLTFKAEEIEEIKTELLNLMESSENSKSIKSLWKINNTPTGVWSICHLLDQGTVKQNAVKMCPRTWNLIQKCPSLMTDNLFGNIAFTVVLPETCITPHYGPTNMRLRCHLGLIIPPKCALDVDGEKREWKEGEVTVFDDSFSHSVEHKGTKEDGIRGAA
ncbi:aspartate beta-hydroxylase domain-containing protein 2-like isoform X2 [Gigantopelta aegis]|uniref:aspartate beta-hydroxylase domain-containing protein 2-like isoform X2 n=1 Tax=Gigantopelta aegis TaxID=1735272 RepID=UPI001B88CA85|nr:aspartate beta-hydroxylase domain-containing protein 2-like isoform X2 [Gigantopelta aegis]